MCGSWVSRISATRSCSATTPAGTSSQRTGVREPEEGPGPHSAGRPRPLRGREGCRLRSHLLRRRSLGANDRVERGAVRWVSSPRSHWCNEPSAHGSYALTQRGIYALGALSADREGGGPAVEPLMLDGAPLRVRLTGAAPRAEHWRDDRCRANTDRAVGTPVRSRRLDQRAHSRSC